MRRAGTLPTAVVVLTMALVLWWVSQPLTIETDIAFDRPPSAVIGPPPEPEGGIAVHAMEVLCARDVAGPAPSGSMFSNGSSWGPGPGAFGAACDDARRERYLAGALAMLVALLGAGLLAARLHSWDRQPAGPDVPIAAAPEP